MVACPDCATAAARWEWGGYTAGCQGCLVRHIAAVPEVIRQQYYARLPNDEAVEMSVAVGAEVVRIAEMRMRAGGERAC